MFKHAGCHAKWQSTSGPVRTSANVSHNLFKDCMITKSKEVGTAEATPWLCPKPLALQLPRIGREASSSSEPATWFSSWCGPKVPDLLLHVQMPCLWMCSNSCTGLHDTRREKGYCSSPPQPSSTCRCRTLGHPTDDAACFLGSLMKRAVLAGSSGTSYIWSLPAGSHSPLTACPWTTITP